MLYTNWVYTTESLLTPQTMYVVALFQPTCTRVLPINWPAWPVTPNEMAHQGKLSLMIFYPFIVCNVYDCKSLHLLSAAHLRTAPVRSMAFSETRLRICSRFFSMLWGMMKRMPGLRMSPFLNTLQREKVCVSANLHLLYRDEANHH